MPLHALEQAAFAAWPALEVEHYRGWNLRFAQGYTKRANSANLVREPHDVDAELDYCERFFRQREQKPIFRLPSFCTPQALDDALADRGYRYVEPSLVMTRMLDGIGPEASHGTRFIQRADEWMPAYQFARNISAQGQGTHLAMLDSIRHPHTFAVSEEGSVPVACGLAVLVEDCVGIFDVATHPEFRNRGLAEHLCRDLMNWGQRMGGRQAYMQVIAANTPAVTLYEKLGFRRAYHYWYRVAP